MSGKQDGTKGSWLSSMSYQDFSQATFVLVVGLLNTPTARACATHWPQYLCALRSRFRQLCPRPLKERLESDQGLTKTPRFILVPRIDSHPSARPPARFPRHIPHSLTLGHPAYYRAPRPPPTAHATIHIKPIASMIHPLAHIISLSASPPNPFPHCGFLPPSSCVQST
ncbi:hypothetical protein C8R44DRAFT_882692 [Mycena epipterygia]|nr:hypothetical protein C8R44DRAFT_882692 [Mycena epipterygia]